MTVSSATRKAGPYTGNGVTTAFAFAFKVFSTADVVVTRADTSGVESTLALTTDYTVSLNADQDSTPGGTVTLNTALASSYLLTLTSSVSETQGSSIQNLSGFYPKVIEAALDRVTILAQQLREKLTRALVIPTSDSSAPASLPSKANRIGKYLAFDADGDPSVASGTGNDSALRTDLAASGGSALVADIEPGTGAQARSVFSVLRERVRVFGRMSSAQIADIQAGTLAVDVRAALQAAFDYAISLPRGAVIEMPGGLYYLGTAIEANNWAQLSLGRYDGSGPSNVDIEAYGAVLYHGRVGRAMGIFKSSRCSVRGLKIIGYCGGVLDSTRQNDACLTINYNSSNVTLEDLYLTNSLGDQIYAGGSLVSGGETGYETRNLVLRGCTLKTRYGDGTASSSGGSMSRTAMAIIDAIGVTVDDSNTIYGGIDCEPNIATQHLVGIHLSPKFLNGNVTAQSVIGADYWHDEPINASGGTIIDGFVATGSVASPITVSDFHVKGATFQQGQIVQTNGNSNYTSITGNKFDNGIIRLTGAVNYTEIKDNFAKGNNPFAETYYSLATPRFVSINGATSYARITGNTAVISGGYCISKEAGGTDTAGNDWSNNRNMHASRLGHMDFSPITGSIGATEEVVSFTPVLSGVTTAGTQTYSQQIGRYTRIGKLIHVYIRILLSAKGGTMAGDVVITGLPHAIANVSNLYTMIPISHANVTLGAGKVLFGQLEPGGSRLYLEQVGSAAGYTTLDSANIANNSEFEISFCYVCN